MLRISNDTKIYIHAPAGMVTGGVELLHQLANYLRNHNKKAYIVYYGSSQKKIPSEYQQYNIETTSYVEDSSENIEIYTDVTCSFLKQNKRKSQKFLWWLSVDNYFKNSAELSLFDLFKWDFKLGKKHFIDRLKCSIYFRRNYFKGKISLSDLSKYDCGYQSEYIHQFLKRNHFKKNVILQDYINTDFYKPFAISQRENIVLYNPKKGLDFTKKIIFAIPNINWIAIENKSRSEILDLIHRSKLYIDFGNHPGKDRLPRECALGGCCVITGKRGSAAYFEDIPIPESYKFDEKSTTIQEIVNKIQWVLYHFNQAINDFSYYREKILNEKKIFEKQVDKIFETTGCNQL
ncbi:MAG: hypothetical protein IJ905_04750 [Fibrobacter sp.]|nr:hypothetical protein [Fibrobacter sp.]